MFPYFGRQRTPLDGRRKLIVKKGYGKNWPKQRKACLERDNYICTKCGRVGKKVKKKKRWYWDVHAHHIIKIKEFVDLDTETVNYQDANDLSNLTTLCENCHPFYDGHKNDSGFLMLR